MKKFKLPLLLFLILIFTYLFAEYIPYDVKAFFLALSLTLKEILLFVLPFIIFSFITNSLLSLEGNVIKFAGLLLLCIFLSNSIAIYTGYFVGSTFLNFLDTTKGIKTDVEILLPFWRPVFPALISNEMILIVGFLFGAFFSMKRNKKVERFCKEISNISNIFLKKFFIPVLPLFVFGFILKLQHEDVLEYAMTVYGKVILLIISTQIAYLCVVYLIAAEFSFKKFTKYVAIVFPATLTGFSTLSSAASMSVLLVSVEKIFKNKSTLYKAIVPAVINTHTIGSAISVTILVLATTKTFSLPTPSFYAFAVFAFFYALAKFGAATVPAGMLFVVTPLLEKYLLFSPEMIGLVTVIYLLSDPFGTATNVTNNAGFTIIFSRIFNFFNKEKGKSIFLCLFCLTLCGCGADAQNKKDKEDPLIDHRDGYVRDSIKQSQDMMNKKRQAPSGKHSDTPQYKFGRYK